MSSLSERLQPLYVPAVADVLDDMGYNNQVLQCMPRPVHPNVKLAGPAVTVSTYWYSSYRSGERDVESLASIFDVCYKGCVVVVSAGTRHDAACWGELMSNAARGRGALGAVVDGPIRDVPKILEISPPFQVFATGFTPADSKGRVEFGEKQVEVVCGGVKVRPGDIVFGDLDGVVIIPKEVAERVISEAEEKVRRETEFRAAIRRGEDFRKSVEKYRVV
ncbi:MAG: RraA family protein [Nitrososphaerota archaeon]